MESIKCPFTPPSESQRLSAIGLSCDSPPKIKKFLELLIPNFSPISIPTQEDWLWQHKEYEQTYEHYKSFPVIWLDPKTKNTIYIQALEKEISEDFIESVLKFARAFYYGIEVKILKDEENVESMAITKRINSFTEKIQYNGGQILSKLVKKYPKDCYCLIGMIKSDIYPDEEWNFVFGLSQQTLKFKTGVFSFARYDENFFSSEPKAETNHYLILLRSIKVMLHEIGHMFGLAHCIYFNCLMNGSNHLEESDKRPMELCPVCIHKLQENAKFDLMERYSALAQAYNDVNSPIFKEIGQWYNKILENVQKDDKQV